MFSRTDFCGCLQNEEDDAHRFSPVDEALARSEVATALRLLRRGVPFSAEGVEMSPLCAAARSTSPELVELLLKRGADVNTRAQGSDYTPLHFAAEDGNLRVMLLLMRAGANLELRNVYGATPLHCAAERGHLPALRLLYRFGANLDSCDNGYRTALHRAAQHGNRDVVAWLLQHGADRMAGDFMRNIPAVSAIYGGHEELMRELLPKEPKYRKELIPYLLQAAVEGKGEAYARRCLDVLPLGAVGDDVLKNLLRTAAERGLLPLVERVLRHGISADARWANSSTPLMLAARHGHVPVLNRLLAAGADVGAIDLFGMTALCWAAKYRQTAAACVLLRAGADPQHRCGDGSTPLSLSLLPPGGDASATAEQLLRAGAVPEPELVRKLLRIDSCHTPCALRMLLAHGITLSQSHTHEA